MPTFSASKWSQGQNIKILSLLFTYIRTYLSYMRKDGGHLDANGSVFRRKIKNLLFSILQLCVLEVLLTLLVNFQGNYYNF